MVRIFLLIILLIHPLFSAVLLNENVYERENRIDLMLSFDTPFKGEIKKRTEKGGVVNILLTDAEIQKPFFQSIRKSFVDSIAVTRSGEKLALIKIIPSKEPIGVQASRTVDGFGLRLRIYPLQASEKTTAATPLAAETAAPEKSAGTEERKESATPLKTLKPSDTLPGWRYWSVMAILLGLLAILWMVRKRGIRGFAKGGGWLMPKTASLAGKIPEEATIRFQKPLDAHNRLLLIEFGGKQYLTIIGNTNLLLDTFGAGNIEAEEDFARMFESNKRQLDHFLKENHPDAYEAFKANASKEEHL